jgi:Cu-Zn family superoxide dismutase
MSGTVTLTQQADGVAVSVQLHGAKSGKHGIHFHEKADCSAPDAASAGGHWNPDQHPHGLPPNPARHMGDLGNIEVGQDGSGTLNLVIQDATLTSGERHSFIGRALILHALEDSGSQPAGGSGAREACAEIKG